MLSLYERDDYYGEMHELARAIETCQQVLAMVSRVDIVRALTFITSMHLQGQAQRVPDDRSDFSHDIALLEAAKTLWLLARYAAKEWQEEGHDDPRPPD